MSSSTIGMDKSSWENQHTRRELNTPPFWEHIYKPRSDLVPEGDLPGVPARHPCGEQAFHVAQEHHSVYPVVLTAGLLMERETGWNFTCMATFSTLFQLICVMFRVGRCCDAWRSIQDNITRPSPSSDLEDGPRARLNDAHLLVLAAGGQQAAISVEGHAEDDVSVAVNHFHRLSDLQIPDQDLSRPARLM